MANAAKFINFPFEILPLCEDINKELLRYFHGERTGFVQVGPERYFFPYKYKNEAENYYNFQARPSDVWVISFPRSGTTWTQELVWLVSNQLDFVTAKRIPLTQRFPFFEFHLFVHPAIKQELLEENSHNKSHQDFVELISTPGYELLSRIPQSEVRFIKTHLPFSLLPPSVMEQNCKIIYISRNPKDVAVSYYHLNCLFRTQGYVGDFERYWNYFQQGLNPWMPYYSHIREAMNHKNKSNILFLEYEEMLSNLQHAIGKVSSFLQHDIDESKVPALVDHLNIKNFRLNASVNGQELKPVGILNGTRHGFIRDGGLGTSISEFRNVPGLLEKAEKWIEENEKHIKTNTS